ncbi:MAG: N-glycosylase/DNA lyase [Candidatus Aenigmatarchaeota archaeon]
MEREIKRVCELMTSDMKNVVDARVSEFAELGRKDERALFSELCFCILTANYSAEGGIRIQNAIGDGFATLPEAALATRLKALGHRYPNARAQYIVEARKHLGSLKRIVSSSNGVSLREWLVTNVKGLGYKEASHFLRNVGFTDVAILDFHIIDILERCGAIVRPKTLTKNKYLEIERVLKGFAARIGVNLAELDLYLWYLETGKVLK